MIRKTILFLIFGVSFVSSLNFGMEQSPLETKIIKNLNLCRDRVNIKHKDSLNHIYVFDMCARQWQHAFDTNKPIGLEENKITIESDEPDGPDRVWNIQEEKWEN